jgi:uncharacterized protein YcfL
MRPLLFFFVGILLFTSCALNSTTYIKPNDAFILGDNPHNSFKVKLKNVSESDIEVYQKSKIDEKLNVQIVKPNDFVTVNVKENTAIVIQNSSNDTATVRLKVTGDLNLSMNYKK